MTSPFLERSIRGRWPRAGVALALCIAPLAAQATDDSLARLKSGVESLKKGELDQALSQISGVQSKLPQVADYITFWIAQIQAQKKNHSAVAPALEPVWKSTPVSPLAGRASVLAAKSLIELESFQDAMNALARAPKETLPQPQAGALQAKAQEGLGDAITAALSWRDVYFGYPLSDEATEAKTALSRLEKELGERYPQPSAQARLDRAQKLLDGRQAAKARDEYEEMIPLLAGAERELAQVGVAAADLKAKRNEIAVAYLKNLRPQTQEAQARRLYFLVSGLRRLNRDSEAMDALEEMSQVAPASPWRLKAIVQSAGNYLVDNDAQHFLPLYAVCASQFPNTPEAANCDWRIAWQAYLQRDSEAARQLRAHLTRFPSSEKAGAALYYLGRLAQESGDYAAARRYWAELQTRFPNYYYTVVVRPRAQAPEVARAGPSPQTDAFLASVRFPERVRKADFTVDAASARRVNRAQLLRRAGLEEWAEGELRFAVRNGANPYPLALELSETAEQRGAPGVALRYVKGTVPGYLALARDGAPPKFWRAAFPFPYRSLVNRYSVEQSLDLSLIHI